MTLPTEPMRSTARLVLWAVLALFGLAVIVFCVSNREAVTVSLYPLPYTITELPLFLWMFGMLVAGSFAGMIVAWVAGHDGRRLSPERKQRIRDLEKELAELRSNVAQPALPPRAAPPAVPSDPA